MAFTFAEEALRTLQNTVSIYQAILAEYATVSTNTCPSSSRRHPLGPECGNMVEILFGGHRVVRMPPIYNKTGLAIAFLVQ